MNSISKMKAPNVEILIVDDNMINLKILEEILKSYEINISTAMSGFECLSLLKTQDKRFDIIFMDYMMPDMDGRETLTRIRQFSDAYFLRLPVIALTGNEIIGLRDDFLEYGFNDYMTKPVDVQTLNKCLRKFISPKRIIEISEDRKESSDFCLQIDGVDTELGLKYSNDNLEGYLDVLRDVCKEADKQKKMLFDFKVQKHWKGYATLSHGLKGEAASVGAYELAAIAKEHEIAAKNCNEEYINRSFHEFIEKYNKLITNIQKVLGQETEKEEIVFLNATLSKDEVEKTIKLIERYEREEAIKNLKWMRGFNLTKHQVETIKAAIQHLEALDFEEANDVILSLI